MSQLIHAIYEDGVIKPLEPLNLAEHQRVRVAVVTEMPVPNGIAQVQHQAMQELDVEMDLLPDCSPDDGFTAAQHDKLLYGDSP